MLKKMAVLAAILGIAFVVMMLTTRSTTFTGSHTETFEQPASRVWQVLTEVDRWSSWWPGMQEARISPALEEGAELTLILKGTPEKSPATVESLTPGRKMAWVRSGILGSTTRTTWQLEEQEGRALVTLETFIRGPQAFLANFTGKKQFAAYHEQAVSALRQQLEKDLPRPQTEGKP